MQSLYGLSVGVYRGMDLGSPLCNWRLRLLGGRVAHDALIPTPISDFDVVAVGRGAVVERNAVATGRRLRPLRAEPAESCSCSGAVCVDPRSTVSHATAVVAAGTAVLSARAPLSALGPSAKPPARTLAVGAPPPALRVVQGPRQPRAALRAARAGRAGAAREAAALPRPLLLRGVAAGNARRGPRHGPGQEPRGRARALEPLGKAGVVSPALPERVKAAAADLSRRNRGLPFADFQHLAGRTMHVFNSAAKVSLAEPFDRMRKDNVDAAEHLLEFCRAVLPKPLHHISTMGVLTAGMLDPPLCEDFRKEVEAARTGGGTRPFDCLDCAARHLAAAA